MIVIEFSLYTFSLLGKSYMRGKRISARVIEWGPGEKFTDEK